MRHLRRGTPADHLRAPRATISHRVLRLGPWLLLFLVLFAGCSVRKLAYALAERMVMRSVDKSFNLTREQERGLRPRVQEVLRWHRATELPRYAAVLARLEREIPDGMSREELNALMADFNAAAERLAQRAAPPSGWVLAQLTDAQVAHAAERLGSEERDRFKDLDLQGEAYVQRRLVAARKQLKTWLGEATDEQMLEVAAYLRQNRPQEERRRAQAKRNRQALIVALRGHPGEAALTALVRGWMERQEVGEARSDWQAEQESRARFLELVQRLDRSLTPAQRRHLLGEIGGWRRDLTELSAGQT